MAIVICHVFLFSILEQPIVNLSILKNGKFTGHVIAFFLFQIVNLGMSFIILNYIQLVNHSSSTVAGLLVFPGAIIGAYFAPFSGRILDRLGAKKPIIFGVSMLVLALCLFSVFWPSFVKYLADDFLHYLNGRDWNCFW